MRTLHHRWNDRAGAVLPIIAISLTTMVAASGSAVDMGRAHMVQSRLSSALDAAGLAAGASANTADVTTEVQKYMNVNFPTGYMGSTLTSLTVTQNEENKLITLAATAELQTAFLGVISIDTLTVSATSEITRANKGMELVLVLDNTGSMSQTAGGGVSKLSASKSAATELLNILYGTNTTLPNMWVGLVPFSQAVNIGTTRASWTTNTALNWGTSSWNGCVEARAAGNNDVTDVPPTTAAFPKYYFPCNTSVNAWFGTNTSRTNCATSPPASVRYRTGQSTSTYGPNLYCPQPVIPMTATKSTVITGINAMQAVGGTLIPTGLSWGWRMLSPNWRDLWGGEMDSADLPLNYNTPLMNKVVVLMTDGDNDIDGSYYSAYGYPSRGDLGANACSPITGSDCNVGEDLLDAKTSTLCESMKTQGIIIYTVSLGTNVSTASKTMLRNCATKPEYFFDSPTTASLQTSFKAIGDSLANLRISK